MSASNQTSGGLKKWLRTERIAFLTLLTLLLVTTYITCDRDPYEVLGVHREASPEQIKKAYRELARKWHPDKSNISGDESGRKFIELNRAFEILKDPVKRSQYDRYGEVNENRRAREQRRRKAYAPTTDSFLKKKSITSHQYYNEYLRESKHRPFLIFFYVDNCPACFMIEPSWIKLTEELAKYNVGSFSLNVRREHRLAHELDVNSVPLIASLVDGQVQYYYQSEISLQSLVRFIKDSLPINLVLSLRTEREQDRHITTSAQRNRLSAIIIDNDQTVKLIYLLLAYALRSQFSFGYVSKKQSDHLAISKRYGLAENSHSHILVFDEKFERTMLHLEFESSNFNVTYLTSRLLERPYLRLPRLSSTQKFDDLCLPLQKRIESRLCIVLLTSITPSAERTREKMIEFKELNGLDRDEQVSFVYVDPDKQRKFVEVLRAETPITQPSFIKESVHSGILLINRLSSDRRRAHYQWIGHRWDPMREDELDRAKIELYQSIEAFKKGSLSLNGKLVIPQLVDEEEPSLLQRVYLRSIDAVSRLAFYLTSRESFSTVSTVSILVTCALLTSLFMYKSPNFNEYNSYDFTYPSTEQPAAPSSKKSSTLEAASRADDLRIIELRAETYNGMVRLLKPGYRSIIVLVDQQTKDTLVKNFRTVVWPYRRNKTLLFGYLCLDKNLKWYKTLLERVLDCDDLKVNKKNCIGTVLSLNGFKKYLRVYHAKHHEIDYYDDKTDNDGSFLGFDDEEADIESGNAALRDNETQEVTYTADNLLDRLPIWLDKMFDGLTKRYFLDQWPEEIN